MPTWEVHHWDLEPHGQYGYGSTNEEGEKWLECLQSLDLHATNTGFQKREQQK